MSNVVFVRHAAHDLLGKRIAGRNAGLSLNQEGRNQAEQLASRLSSLPLEAVYSSPLERALETAEPIARRLALETQVAPEFQEVEFGEWTNCTFEELAGRVAWQQFNTCRSWTVPPGGESMVEVQGRVVRKLNELRRLHEWFLVVSHGDTIRATVAHFLGLHLDLFLRLEIDPGSISIVEIFDDFARVRLLNAPPRGEPLQLPGQRAQ